MIDVNITRTGVPMFLPITYTAPNPYPQKRSWWSFLSPTGSTLFSDRIGKLVLPAQHQSALPLSEKQLQKLYRTFGVVISRDYIFTHDGAAIDTIQLIPKDLSEKKPQDLAFLIKFNPNGGLYENAVVRFANDAAKLQRIVIGFNYRNVGLSKSPNHSNLILQHLVTDGIAQVNRLLDLGVAPEKITLDGISLGGAVATKVAEYFHDQNKHVYLWNDRSLASLSKVSAGYVVPECAGQPAKLCFSSLENTFFSILKPNGWEADIAAAYRRIPEEYKGYMVVAKKSFRSTGDGVIHHKASLHYGVKEKEKWTGQKTGQKVLSLSLFGGHNEPRKNLVSKEDPTINAQTLFENFVLRQK